LKKIPLHFFLIAFSFFLNAQIPAYYDSIDFNKSGEELKSHLSYLITNTHVVLIPYTSSNTDTWDILKQSDLDTDNNQNVSLIYGYSNTDGLTKTDRTRNKTASCHTSSCIGFWNREHVFAQSLATPSLDTGYPSSGTDVHSLRIVDSQMNSSRNNRFFAEAVGNSTITPQGHFYPGDEWKGDVARIIMYMYLRYPTQCLPNNIGVSANSYNIDMRDIFLDWNAEDPVSTFEIQRNNVIASVQGNRNPFIDNPYLATLIWGGSPASNTWSVLNINDSLEYENELVSLFPNPVTTSLQIRNCNNPNIKLIIYSIDGKEIKVLNNQKTIDVSTLQNGFYLLKVVQDNQSQIIKFIKH